MQCRKKKSKCDEWWRVSSENLGCASRAGYTKANGQYDAITWIHIFFCSVSKKSKKLVHHGHPRGVLECSIFGILVQCKKKSKCDEWWRVSSPYLIRQIWWMLIHLLFFFFFVFSSFPYSFFLPFFYSSVLVFLALACHGILFLLARSLLREWCHSSSDWRSFFRTRFLIQC